jgi:hypothetical protein
MFDFDLFPVLVATVVAIVVSGAYYAALGAPLARVSRVYAEPDRQAVATLAVELARTLVVVIVVAGLAAGLGLQRLPEALQLALVLWIGFPAVVLAGSVFHERVRPLLAAIHAGDWLVKLAIVSVIVTVWP